jgi:hypothetical protein
VPAEDSTASGGIRYNAAAVERAERKRDALAIAFLLVLASLPLIDLFFGQRLFIRDITRYYYPTKSIVREVLLNGEFPFWNPYYSAGQPMAANPEYEVFYPPQLLILLPDYDLGFRLHILIHFHFAAIGMFLLLRSMAMRRPAAIYGAVVFAFSGLFLSLVNLLPILFCATWIPWVLLFARRFLIGRRIGDFSLAALFLGLQILTLEPTTLLQTWFLVSAYAAYRAFRDRRGGLLRALTREALLVVLLVLSGVAVGAVQFVPGLDHAAQSACARPFPYELVTAWSFPPQRALELVFPNFFGHMSRDGMVWYWGSGLYPNTSSPFFFSIYLGLLGFALAAGGMAARIRGWWLTLAVAGVSILLAAGGNTPLFRLLYDAGIAQSIRYPEKFTLMGILAMIVFSARSFDAVAGGNRRVLRGATVAAAVAMLVAAGVTLFTFSDAYSRAFRYVWGLKANAGAARMTAMSWDDWSIATMRGGALLLILMLAARGRHRAFAVLAIAFTMADLLHVGYELNPRKPARYFTPPAVVEELSPARSSYRIFHEIDWYGSSPTARKFFSTGSGVYWVVRNGLFPMTPATWGFRTVLERDYDKTALLPTIDLVDAMWAVSRAGRSDWRQIFMGMSNARYLARYADFEKEKESVRERWERSRPVVFGGEYSNPRYYFASTAVGIGSVDDFVRLLVTRDWPRDAAFVSGSSWNPAGGRVLRAAETFNTVELEVDSEGRGLLILSVTPQKYWRATVGGRPAPIEVVNVGYQGIVIPPGRHEVRLEYRNDLVVVSGIVSLAAAGMFLSFVVVTRRRRRGVQDAAA